MKTIVDISVDYSNLARTTVWSRLSKRIDRYNMSRGRQKGLHDISLSLDITYASPVIEELRHIIDAMTKGAVGFAARKTVEGERAVVAVTVDGTALDIDTEANLPVKTRIIDA